MDSKWFALGIVPAASAAVLLFVFAASSSATAPQQSSPTASEALPSSGFCKVEVAEVPKEIESCSATVAPPAEREAAACPVTGARGKSSLHLEEVLGRVHDGLGACPHPAASNEATERPHLSGKETERARTDSKRKQGTWL